MRLALLNLELQDKSLQRQLIDPPTKFANGPSSIGDNDRVRIEKVKLYFPAAFGGRKFTGKKNSNVGIIVKFSFCTSCTISKEWDRTRKTCLLADILHRNSKKNQMGYSIY